MNTHGQIAYAAYHGMSLPLHADEWPEGDRMVARWERVGAAVVGAMLNGAPTLVGCMNYDGDIELYDVPIAPGTLVYMIHPHNLSASDSARNDA